MTDKARNQRADRLSERMESLSRQISALARGRNFALTAEDVKSIKAIELPLAEDTVPRHVPYHLSEEDTQLVSDVYEHEKEPRPYFDDPLEALDNMRYVELPPHIVFAVYLRQYWDMRGESAAGEG